jgi:hypothetical protein
MANVRFESLPTISPVAGEPRFVREDHAFEFRMVPLEKVRVKGPEGTTSLVVGTLQLEVAIYASRCLYVWGFCPIRSWHRADLSTPTANYASLRANCGSPLIPGVSIVLEGIPATPWFDPASGWFCMGEKESTPDSEAVEFATECVAVVVRGRLASLWIKPDNWKELIGEFSARE